MTFLSPAKLNLGLKITGKRADGYHLLKTVFCLIDLFDEIQIQTTPNGKISLIEHNQAWLYHTDLSYKAAKLLQSYSGTKLGANIRINKAIPSGAGLGGGSSNAATVLLVLNNLWQLNLNTSKLIELGTKLGADVPFFIHGKNAVASGIGDIFNDISLPNWYFVLICPKFHIKTANVFKNVEFSSSPQTTDKDGILDSLENDLLPAAIKFKPELGTLLKKLQFFGHVAMTGSGSSLYLRFDNQDDAKKIAKKIADVSGNEYNTYLVKSLNISPVSSNSL